MVHLHENLGVLIIKGRQPCLVQPFSTVKHSVLSFYWPWSVTSIFWRNKTFCDTTFIELLLRIFWDEALYIISYCSLRKAIMRCYIELLNFICFFAVIHSHSTNMKPLNLIPLSSKPFKSYIWYRSDLLLLYNGTIWLLIPCLQTGINILT